MKLSFMVGFDILSIYLASLLFLELTSLIFVIIKRRHIKPYYIFSVVLILSLLSTLFLDIDWDFIGENKDGIITGKLFIFLIFFTNLINIAFIAIYWIINRLTK
jgi:hypothetical protein